MSDQEIQESESPPIVLHRVDNATVGQIKRGVGRASFGGAAIAVVWPYLYNAIRDLEWESQYAVPVTLGIGVVAGAVFWIVGYWDVRRVLKGIQDRAIKQTPDKPPT